MRCNKISLKFSLVGLLLAPYSNIWAQQNQNLNLQTAIEKGLNNSKSLKASSASIVAAQAQLQEYKNNRLPDLKLSGAYMRINHPDISLKYLDGSSSGSGSSAADIKPNSLMYGMATASMPLFAGGQITNAVNSANYLVKAAQLDSATNRDSVVLNIISAYYNLYKATAALQLVKENVATQQQRVKDFKNLETNGVIARNDLLKAELQESNSELSLVDAQNQLQVVNYNFNLLLGQDANIINEVDTSGMSVLANPGSVSEWENVALNNRSDLQALQNRLTALDYNIKSTKGGYFPTVAATAGYVAMDIPKTISITNAVNVGVSVSYNVASLFKNKAKVQAVEAQKQNLYWNQQALSDGVRMQIYSAYSTYINSLKKIEVYKVAVDQANENYRITKNKYDNSLATTTDLLDADVAKLQANINFAYSKADAVVAYNTLYKASGTVNKDLIK